MFDSILSTGAVVSPQVAGSVHTLLTDLLQTVLLLLVSGASWGVKLWINSMHSAWKQALAERFVKYAEQKIADDTEKQKWVADQLSAKLKGKVSSDEINHLIEEAVVNLKAQLNAPAVSLTAPALVAMPQPEVPKP